MTATTPPHLAASILQAQGRYYLARLSQQVVAALKAAMRRADVDEAARALERGDVEGAVTALIPRASMVQLSQELSAPAVEVMLASMRRVLRVEVPPVLRVRAGVLPVTDYTLAALSTLTTTRVEPLVRGTEQAVRDLLMFGQLDGQHPDVTARWAREAIGFTPEDVRMIESFETQLRADPARALTRTLRDRRFDGTVRQFAAGTKTPTEAQLSTYVDAYERGLRAWRAETFSRSTTLDALRQGQATAWADAAQANGIGLDELVKTWITTLDGRERDAHHAMHGTTIPFDEPYEVPGAGPEQVPGEGEYNCRCGQAVRLLPASGTRGRTVFEASRAAIAAEAPPRAA